MPTEVAPGEVGLRAEAPDGNQRRWKGDGWELIRSELSGIDATAHEGRPFPTPISLYLALGEARIDPNLEGFRSLHLLELLGNMAWWLESPCLANLLLQERELARRYFVFHADGWLRKLVDLVSLPSNRGRVTLQQLVTSPDAFTVLQVAEDRSWDESCILYLNERAERFLTHLVSPPCRLTSQAPLTAPLEVCIHKVPRPLSSIQLLQAFLAREGECAARELLAGRELRFPDEPPEPDGAAVLNAAARQAPPGRRLGTADVLCAMLRYPCQARAVLLAAGVDPELEPDDSEQAKRLFIPRNPVLRQLGSPLEEAVMHLLAGRHEAARPLARLALIQGARASLALAFIGLCLEDLALAEEAVRRDPDSYRACQIFAELLLRQGKEPEAKLQVARALELNPDSPQALILCARMEPDPARKLERCERALRQAACPDTVWEVHARALFELGRDREARLSLERFVRLRPGHSWEPDIRDRLAAAQRKLRETD